MGTRLKSRQELELVNMLIRALAYEMASQRARAVQNGPSSRVMAEMNEALYGLRLKKLLISASV